MEPTYVLAIDQGTTSSRSILFNHAGEIVAKHQLERADLPAGRMGGARSAGDLGPRAETMGVLAEAGINRRAIAAVGITNQRETTLVWDKRTGEPVYNAIVVAVCPVEEICERLAASFGPERYRQRVGLPLSTYFAGPNRVDSRERRGRAQRAERGELLFRTSDTWVLWNLTGGTEGGVHATDVTRASRTMLMDLRTLQWDEEIAAEMGIPMSMLPEIRSSSIFGYGPQNGLLVDTPIAGILGTKARRPSARPASGWAPSRTPTAPATS